MPGKYGRYVLKKYRGMRRKYEENNFKWYMRERRMRRNTEDFCQGCRKKAAMKKKMKTGGRGDPCHAVIAFCLPRRRLFCRRDAVRNLLLLYRRSTKRKRVHTKWTLRKVTFPQDAGIFEENQSRREKTSNIFMRQCFSLRISICMRKVDGGRKNSGVRRTSDEKLCLVHNKWVNMARRLLSRRAGLTRTPCSRNPFIFVC